jgi:hypothetical protein
MAFVHRNRQTMERSVYRVRRIPGGTGGKRYSLTVTVHSGTGLKEGDRVRWKITKKGRIRVVKVT